MPVGLPPWRAVPDRTESGNALKGIQPAVEVARLGFGGYPLHRFVKVAMVPDLVPTVDDGLDRARVALCRETGDEERGADVLAFEQAQQPGYPDAGTVGLMAHQ